MLTIRDVKRTGEAKLAITPANLALANEALDQLWAERLEERGYEKLPSRGGSCKFAALLTRELFGGKLDGNLDHVFVRKDKALLDLNEQQEDVLILGAAAHLSTPWVLEHKEYRQSLGSCMPRVQRWAQWVLEQAQAQCVAPERHHDGSERKFASPGRQHGDMDGP